MAKIKELFSGLPDFEKVKEVLFSKSLIGALLLALSLWSYSRLNDEYVTFIEVPLQIDLPSELAIENPLPSEVSVEVRGSGWHHFNLFFFNSAKKVYVDLTRHQVQDSIHIITRSDLIKSVQYMSNVEAIDVVPETITLNLGNIVTKKIPVEPVIEVKTRNGFLQIGKAMTIPDSITIRGNKKILENVNSWKTEKITYEDAHKDFNIKANLSDTLGNIIGKSVSGVVINVDVQQIAETEVPDVPVVIRGGSLPKNHGIQPELIDITIRGGIEQLSDFNIGNVSAYLSYSQIMNDSTGVLIPEIVIPEHIILLRTEPKYIYHYKYLPESILSGN